MKYWLFISMATLLIVSGCDRKWSNIYDPDSDISSEWAPKNLQIAQTATNTVKLVWENQDERIDGFILDRRTGVDQPWEENYRIIDRDFREITDTTGLDMNLSYRLQAFADEAISSSTEDTIRTDFPAPGMLEWISIDESTVEFSWDAHPFSDVTAYQVERKTNTGLFTILDSVWSSAYRDTTLSTSDEYSFRFRAIAGDLLSEATPEKSLRWQTGNYSLAWEASNANGVHGIEFNAGGDRMAVIGGWTFNIYNSYTGDLLWTGSHNSGTNAVTFYKDKWVISSGWDGIKRWDSASGEMLETNSDYDNYRRMLFSPDSVKMYISAYGDGLVACLNPIDLKDVFWENDGDRWVNSMDLNSDGSLLVIVTTGGNVDFINTSDGSIADSITDGDFGWDCQFSPDGSMYAGLGTSKISIYRSDDHSLLWEEIDYQNIKRVMAFSHDGSKIAFSRGDTLKVVHSDNGRLIWRAIIGSNAGINDIKIRPDDGSLLTAHRDGGMRLWDLNSGAELWSYLLPDYADDCAFSPDNNRFAAGDYTGNLKVWIEKIWVEIGGL